mgnify:CR=1 FL=1
MKIIIGILIIYIIYQVLKRSPSNKKSPLKTEATFRFESIDPRPSASAPKQLPKPKERPTPKTAKTAKWYRADECVSVQGYDITGGLIYVGEMLLDSSGYGNDACLINPKLKTAPAEPWEDADEMGYWPQYETISPKCRGAYLKWLADGRAEPEAYVGYVFLFFYGLERRLFVDGPKENISAEERLDIVREVIRLRKIYGGNRSFHGYASNFLAMEWVLYESDQPAPDYLDFDDRYCSEPFQVVLAQYVAAGKPIPADVALRWIILHPEFGLRTPARRCAKEFRALFLHRYTQQFGDGLIIKPNKTPLKLEYHAASSSIRGALQLKFPELRNPFILKAPLKKIGILVEECTTQLEPYSRFIGRKNNDPTSLAALALLPKELMLQAPTAQKAQSLLMQISSHGAGLISTESLYTGLEERVPLQIGKKESENLATMIEGMGFGIAPDIRFHNIKPTIDGNVVIFPKGHGIDFRPSREFRTLITILRLGAIVSQIDNDLSPAEEATLQTLINESRELTQIEKESLLAFLHWCLNTPQGTAGIKQRLADVSSVEKTAISHILISVAYADGRIDPREVKQLEKIYTTLGLNKEQVTSDLHTLAAANEPVTVGLRDREPSYAIPSPDIEPVQTKGFSLNEELIRIRTEETRQVRGVLEEIFADQVDDQDDDNLTVDIPTTKNPLESLDTVHQTFFHRLLEQETWERSAMHDLCKELGLMVNGAMEVLNEWAFDHANAPLIDDGEPVFVDVDLAKEIVNG